MMNVGNFFKKELSKEQMVSYVLEQEEHRWISEHTYVKANFTDFLERLPKKVLQKIFFERVTTFARSNGRYACAVTPLQQNVIIVFPELFELLTKTYDGWAKAVLAHEIGHIMLEHSENSDDPMEAQVDADTFACDMGYLDELESFLHEQPETVEKRVRLTFITNYYFANN